ncbi:hypothetical protein [Dyadobacter psychrotolerans]|uniref:Uncharacterized protein n=1 Tax=Dyadobacter psychrotolerans TaxID=2541721 RepID=A0A4R5DFQ7_9BACT|nr:hypothetical protein [Dyadobacter psychrotolerans]TDE10731.1 hypothetical protein E0F88_27030 [Dyadobacter psychrotolerans]
MNERNFNFLTNQLKYTGFGEGLQTDLKVQILKDKPEFTLSHQTRFGRDQMQSELYFKRSSQSDLYFFNRFTSTLNKQDQNHRISHIFYNNKQTGNITLKEAYNLLDGRAVNKDLLSQEGKLYVAWLQLDFKQTTPNGNYKMDHFNQRYGFEMEKAVSALPIKELSNQLERSRLFASLQKGNRQAVHFLENGREHRFFIEVNPRFKAVIVFDENENRVFRGQQMKNEQASGLKENIQIKSDKIPEINIPKPGNRKGLSM